MGVYAIDYYNVDEAESLVRDESLPMADELFSVVKEGSGNGEFKSIGFTIYRWSDIFIVQSYVNFAFPHEASKEELFLAVLREGKRRVAIVDWVDSTRSCVFILPFDYLNVYVGSLMRKGWLLYLAFDEPDVLKKMRRFGSYFSYLREVFRKELAELEKIAEKGVKK